MASLQTNRVFGPQTLSYLTPCPDQITAPWEGDNEVSLTTNIGQLMRFLVDYELLRGRFMENFKRNFSIYEIFQRCSLLARCFEPVHRIAQRCFLIVLSMAASNSLFFKLSTCTSFIMHQYRLGGLWFRFQFTRIIHFYIFKMPYLNFAAIPSSHPRSFDYSAESVVPSFTIKAPKYQAKLWWRWINFSKRCTTNKRYSLQWMMI